MKKTRLRTWNMPIVGYLFVVGVAAGAFGVLAIMEFLEVGSYRQATLAVAALSLVLIGGGTLLLLLDLDRPERFFRVLLNPVTSMLSIGAWILILFTLSLLAYIFFGGRVSALVGFILAIATAGYTGMLLGVIKSRPFWNTPLLPLLFLVSAFSTGIATVTLLAKVLPPPYSLTGEVLHRLYIQDSLLILVELCLIALYLVIMYNSTTEAGWSVQMLTRGEEALPFWGGLVGAGLVLPLLISLSGFAEIVVAPLVLIGGFYLRYTFLRTGLRPLLPGEAMEASYL